MLELSVLFQSPKSCASRRFLSKSGARVGRVYLQIGAGAGDQDPRTGHRDGFTSFVKSVRLRDNDQVILIEPHPENIEYLKRCWSGVSGAEVLQLAVLPQGEEARRIKLYYSQEDGPHFQVTSCDRDHVARHYCHRTIRSFEVEAVPIDLLIEQFRQGRSLELLGIDVEGLDADILMSMDFADINFQAISFESVHMGGLESTVRQRLQSYGYVPAGVGLDVHGLDSLFLKPNSIRVALLAHVWEMEREAHLPSVSGRPWQSFLYLINWFRTRKL